ncbi:arf-GAP with Rho-GAP domain, ANK repeat and PH domain-containing protein 2 [Discoglossus pictus]
MSSLDENNDDVGQMLAGIHLEIYEPVFKTFGFHTISDCENLNHEKLQEIGIALTGHRKRILNKLQSLILYKGNEAESLKFCSATGRSNTEGILSTEAKDFKSQKIGSLDTTLKTHEHAVDLDDCHAEDITGTSNATYNYYKPEKSNENKEKGQVLEEPSEELASNREDNQQISMDVEEQLDSQNSSFFEFQGTMVDNEIYSGNTNNKPKTKTPTRSFILRNRPVPQLPFQVNETLYQSYLQEKRNSDIVNSEDNSTLNTPNYECADEILPPITPYEETFFFNNSELPEEISGDNFLVTKDNEHNEETAESRANTLHDYQCKTSPSNVFEPIPKTSEESIYSKMEECSLGLGVNKDENLTNQSLPNVTTHNENISSEDIKDSEESYPDDDSISPYACFYEPSTMFSKAGWLDKLSPHSSCMFQKRWVKVDGSHISYYHSDRDVYSKGKISLSAITKTQLLGESKIEIVTSLRTYIFRVEKEGDRHDWIRAVHHALKSQANKAAAFSLGDKIGYLELRGYKNKIFTMINGSKLWLSKSKQDASAGISVTDIKMTMATVKDIDRKCFEIITPFRNFCFTAESEREKQEWIEAVQQAIADTLADYEVAEKVWFNESNRSCADCHAPNPDWASINLGVVICKDCAGHHRSMGSKISKVHSLKLDSTIWSNELVELFIVVGNEKVNSFWEANLISDSILHMASSVNQRRLFITQKYKEGRFKKTDSPPLTREQKNEALCAAVIKPDVLETMILVFSGADIMCTTGDPNYSTPYLLAKNAGQCLQMEFLHHNRFSDYKTANYRTECGASENLFHCGFLYKASSSSSKMSSNKKLKEEMKRWWCTIEDSFLSYYENEKTSVPDGVVDLSEGTCLVAHPPELNLGAIFTFEIYLLSERMFLFGTENAESHREWTRAIVKNFVPTVEKNLVELDFHIIGYLYYKDSYSLHQWKENWFALEKTHLHYFHSQDNTQKGFIQLKKLQELTTSSTTWNGEKRNTVLLVENGRTLYIHGHTILDFMVWHSAIEKAAGTDGNALQDQQLSKSDIPIIVNSCIAFVTQYGLGSKSLYLKNGNPLNVKELLEDFKKDARSIKLKVGKHQLEDVTDVLKCFLYEIDDALLTKELYPYWISALDIEDEKDRAIKYRTIIETLSAANKATLAALIEHLYRVQKCSDINHLDTHILATSFSACLFQTNGQNDQEVSVTEDLITHYVSIFQVSKEQVQQMDTENRFITKWKDTRVSHSGDMLLEVYLERKDPEMSVIIRVPPTMEAEELTYCATGIQNIALAKETCWAAFEVIENGELERPIHSKEKVLETVLQWGLLSDPGSAYLLVKPIATSEITRSQGKKTHGMSGYMKYKEDPSKLLSGNKFQERYFVLQGRKLLLYKDIKSIKPEKVLPVIPCKIYVGVKKKFKPPTNWGLTIYFEKHQWQLCCDTQEKQMEWLTNILSVQHSGDVFSFRKRDEKTTKNQVIMRESHMKYEKDTIKSKERSETINPGSEKMKWKIKHAASTLEINSTLKQRSSMVAEILERKDDEKLTNQKKHYSMGSLEDPKHYIGVSKEVKTWPSSMLNNNSETEHKLLVDSSTKLPPKLIKELNLVLQKNRKVNQE